MVPPEFYVNPKVVIWINTRASLPSQSRAAETGLPCKSPQNTVGPGSSGTSGGAEFLVVVVVRRMKKAYLKCR